MLSEDRVIAFCSELRDLCQKHGIYLIGTCASESILGEIELTDNPRKGGVTFRPSVYTWTNDPFWCLNSSDADFHASE